MSEKKEGLSKAIGKTLVVTTLVFVAGIGVTRSLSNGGGDRGQDLRINVAMPELAGQASAAEDQPTEEEVDAELTDAEQGMEIHLSRLEVGRNAQAAALLEQLERDRTIALCHRARQYLASANEANQSTGIAVEVWLENQASEVAERARIATNQVTAFSGTLQHQEAYQSLYWEATAIALAYDHLWRGNPLECPVLSPFSTWAQFEEVNMAGKAVRNAR